VTRPLEEITTDINAIRGVTDDECSRARQWCPQPIPCTTCGNCIPADLRAIVAKGRAVTHQDNITHVRDVYVCDDCLQAGDINKCIEENIRRIAVELEFLRSLVGCVHVPTLQEVQARREAESDAWHRQMAEDDAINACGKTYDDAGYEVLP
jgi:hypothetical protein